MDACAGSRAGRIDMNVSLRTTLLSLVFAVAMTSCATGQKMRNIQPGMDRAAVEKLVGAPDGYQKVNDVDVLTYKNRLMTGSSWDRADYQVVLKDGRVTQYGPGEVRQANNNTGVLIVAPIGRR